MPALLDDGWPLLLFALRVGAVVLLYLFLATAFRTLWAELRAPVAAPAPPHGPEQEPEWEQADQDAPEGLVPLPPPVPAAGALARSSLPAGQGLPDEWAPDARRTHRPSPPRARRGWRIPVRVAIPAVAAVALVVLGGVAALTGDEPPGETATTVAPTSEPFGPPAVAPPAGRVTVGLAAPEDANVRVTVDGVVQFDGTLRAGQRQSWEGSERIQVWTDNGRTLLLAVNGDDLGPYSPAMQHPDWNRIDFGFWPGWTQ